MKFGGLQTLRLIGTETWSCPGHSITLPFIAGTKYQQFVAVQVVQIISIENRNSFQKS